MPLTVRQTQRQASVRAGRDPANDLYDRACDLLASGQALRAAAQRDGHQPALAAALGCIESTLREISASCVLLSAASDRLIEDNESSCADDLHASRLRVGRQFRQVVDATRHAADHCSTTRAAAGPLLAELTALGR